MASTLPLSYQSVCLSICTLKVNVSLSSGHRTSQYLISQKKVAHKIRSLIHEHFTIFNFTNVPKEIGLISFRKFYKLNLTPQCLIFRFFPRSALCAVHANRKNDLTRIVNKLQQGRVLASKVTLRIYIRQFDEEDQRNMANLIRFLFRLAFHLSICTLQIEDLIKHWN